MRKFLIRKFVTNYNDTKSAHVRQSYGKLASIVGIISNAFICVLKIVVGYAAGSIAIVADGINNFADATSSIITLFGFKLASIKEDAKHPYGHGRFEYLAALLVSALVMVVGVQLLLGSIDKIRSPEPVGFSYIIVAVLLVSIVIKLWQALFNVNIGKTINSGALKATATDSRNDVISTSAVLISLIIGEISGINVDGFMGALVALFIIYSGVQLVRETIDPLLGQPPDPELVKEITERIQNTRGILGLHDLVIHDYGPGRIFASVHAEVDAKVDILFSHDMIDNIEKEVSRDRGIELVIHMDPVDIENPIVHDLKKYVIQEIKNFDSIEGMHDLRIVPGKTHTNVLFDLVLRPGNSDEEVAIREYFDAALKAKDPTYETVITFDIDYTV